MNQDFVDDSPNYRTMPVRIRETHGFQYKPYHNLTMDVTLEITDIGPIVSEDVIAEGVKVIQEGFGKALLLILKRYHENMQDDEIQTYLNAIIPPSMKITIRDNEILMDGLMLAARSMLNHGKD